MASRRRRRNSQQIPKNVKVIVATSLALIMVIILAAICITAVRGAAITAWKVGALFMGLLVSVCSFFYSLRQIKAPGYDTAVTIFCAIVSFVSMAVYLFVYVIGVIGIQ